MFKLITFVVIFIAGCAVGETTNRSVMDGQWTPAEKIGPKKYMLQGYSTQDAVKGATEFCARTSQQLSTENIEPHTNYKRATIIFGCI